MSEPQASEQKSGNDYKHTLSLPETAFSMKADLPNREPQLLSHWQEIALYQKVLDKNRGRPEFRLHDGPPYANGTIHHGHMLNKILKDIVVKYRSMSGNYVEYIPGWDCHGLPIEHQVDKELGEKRHTLSQADKRKACETYARKWIDAQRRDFIRLGVFGAWDQPYLTMNHDYEAAVTRMLAKFSDRGNLVRGKKPVHWCYVCETALAEAEVEYENHTSSSIYVKYPIRKGLPTLLEQWLAPRATEAASLIWTTTPWTLPASLAIAVAKDADYVLAEVENRKNKRDVILIADSLLEAVLQAAGAKLLAKSSPVKGAALCQVVSEHPWLFDRQIPTLLGEHVTLDAGTGLVHTAPGHGPDDFHLGRLHNIDPLAPVNGKGIFTSEAGEYAGLHITKANSIIVANLDKADRLFNRPDQTLTHSYPHCWRSHTPVIFLATPQWFITLDHAGLRTQALKEIDATTWIPRWGRDRIYKMIETRPDWCISRQRAWGVPIPAFFCQTCDEPLATGDVMRHIADIFEQQGTDAWFIKRVEELLPPNAKCSKCEHLIFRKETDILDVWFESGASYSAVYKNSPLRQVEHVVDLYLEGSDQHRGWFHSALLCGVGAQNRAPYEAVLTHGFVVDGQGKALSKSKGNYTEPQKVIAQRGAEIIRLWVAGEDYREDIRVSEEILQRLTESYRKIRNTLRFIFGNLHDFDVNKHQHLLGDATDPAGLDVLDVYALHQLEVLTRKVHKAYAEYQFHQVFHLLNTFCAIELSSFYFDVLKDRLYVDAPHSVKRRSAQATLWNIGYTLLRLMAPVLCFTAEEAYGFLPKSERLPTSIHLCDLPPLRESWFNEVLAKEFSCLIKIRDVVLKQLEEIRREGKIGSGLGAHVVIHANHEDGQILLKHQQNLASYFIVSAVEVEVGTQDVSTIQANIAAGKKCARCWIVKTDVGQHIVHPTLCTRCAEVVEILSSQKEHS